MNNSFLWHELKSWLRERIEDTIKMRRRTFEVVLEKMEELERVNKEESKLKG